MSPSHVTTTATRITCPNRCIDRCRSLTGSLFLARPQPLGQDLGHGSPATHGSDRGDVGVSQGHHHQRHASQTRAPGQQHGTFHDSAPTVTIASGHRRDGDRQCECPAATARSLGAVLHLVRTGWDLRRTGARHGRDRAAGAAAPGTPRRPSSASSRSTRTPPTRSEIAREVITSLSVHAGIEEVAFYPSASCRTRA